MNRVNKSTVIVALLLGLASASELPAQSSGGPYRIDPVAIAGGGGPIVGGPYQITSTIGQAATSTLSGASYVVFDGFWSPVGGGLGDIIFINGFESN
ncbi:MAG: hypothetical protein ABI082_04930 [Dokdonella sp.]